MSSKTEVTGGFLDTPRATAMLVIGSVLFLALINRGFRGVSAGGVSVGIR